MSDPDADAVLATFAHPEAGSDSDAAAVLASLSAPKKESAPPRSNLGTGYIGEPNLAREPTAADIVADRVVGGTVRGIAGGYQGLKALVTGKGADAAADAVNKVTGDQLQPTTPSAQAASSAMASPLNPLNLPATVGHGLGRGAEALGAPPVVSAGLEALPTALGAAAGLRGGGAAEAAPEASASDSPQSMGAAKTSPMAGLSPELQNAVRQAAQKTGGAIPPETLARHAEADSLPVKIQLTPGQATQDPATLSTEMNNRAKTPGLPQLLQDQNAKLTQNVQALRDKVGPDVFSTNPVEHGDTLIKAYQDKGAAADADISSKYKALRDAAGGDFPVSAPTLLKNATGALNQELLLDHAPKSIMSTLGRLSDSDNMTYQNFESLRTNLARIQRSSTDGNERAAAGVIRNSMEELPLKPGAAELKPLADTARAAARAQFQALDADPAYKAAVNESVPPDRFVQKYVIGGNRDDVATMKANLADNPTATQTMSVATLDHLRRQAGVDDMGNGNFSQAGFNKHLQALGPKLNSLVDPGTAEQLQTLGNVARYTQAQPRGSFVNNSNTLVGALAGHAANAAEGIANVKAGGFPVGTIVRKALQNRSDAKAAAETMAPYGGLTKLSDVAKQ